MVSFVAGQKKLATAVAKYSSYFGAKVQKHIILKEITPMKRIYINDLILNIIIILLCIALPIVVSVMSKDDVKTALVSVDGQEVKQLPLSENACFGINGMTVEVRDGAANVTHSDCPDGLCVKMKEAKNVGDSIICVPNKVSVRIVGTGRGEADVVAG